ncbi:MAG: DEAD/DEAH box helicase family protein [Candidatus Pacebacteria bacterium]|nr:DEAD/DEAH box helicase family protein [Candidatus Paceibacterota bacterium]
MENRFMLIVANLLSYVPINVFRKGQETFYTEIRQAIIDGFRTMYISGPTGIGKSFLQATIADAIINGAQDIKILILVPKIDLLSQMKNEFTKFAVRLVVGLRGGGWKSNGQHVTVMMYQTFIKLSNDELKQYSVIFLDEAHLALGPVRRAKVDEQQHAIIIGFTATPEYSDEKNLKEWLGLEVHRISVSEAVEVGMLSGIQFMTGKVKIKIAGRLQGEATSEYTERISSDIIRQGGNIAATRLYKKLFQPKGLRFVMFTLTVEQGRDLVEELVYQGVTARLIEGAMSRDDRRDLFDDFKDNKFEVLVGVDVPKTGFDDEGVCGVIFAYPVGSLVGLTQGAGRATRLWKLMPDKIAYVVQLMFEGRDQVFYSQVLEGNSMVMPKVLGEREMKGMRKRLISTSDIEQELCDEILESVHVTEEEVMRVVKEYTDEYVRERAPEGWFTASQITRMDDVQGQLDQVKALAEIYRSRCSLWFMMYLSGPNWTEHYAPDLVAILKKQCARKKQAPEGWMTASQIGQMDDVWSGDVLIKNLAEIHRSNHPDWFGMYFSGNNFTEHYAPDLVDILKEARVRQDSPEGWYTANQISKMGDVLSHSVRIKKLAEEYRAEHSDWFKMGKTGSNFTEHYAPDLVAILKDLCILKSRAPEGWYTANQISKFSDVQGKFVLIKNLAEGYRKDHPQWFRVYLIGPRTAEHYAPDLVAILKDLCKRKK